MTELFPVFLLTHCLDWDVGHIVIDKAPKLVQYLDLSIISGDFVVKTCFRRIISDLVNIKYIQS